MSKILQQKFNFQNFYRALTKNYSVAEKISKKSIQLPQQADVVIIGNVICSICLRDLIENQIKNKQNKTKT